VQLCAGIHRCAPTPYERGRRFVRLGRMSPITSSRQLAAEGLGPNDLTRMVRSGELVRLRRGAYVDPGDGTLDPRAAHLRLLEATLPHCDPAAVISHTSAAVVHRLPVWDEHLARIHVTRNREGGGRTRRLTQVHGGVLADAEVTDVGGLRVTTTARTVVDVARSLPLVQAVAAGDAALSRVSRTEIEQILADQAGRTGIARARVAVAFLDPRSESAGESFSRVVLHRAGLPRPELQYEVLGLDGRLVGRCDFGWPEFKVLGEFDGKKKYGELLRRPGQTAEDVLIEEKRREDRLRALGWIVIRWMWSDLHRPEALVAQLRTVLTPR